MDKGDEVDIRWIRWIFTLVELCAWRLALHSGHSRLWSRLRSMHALDSLVKFSFSCSRNMCGRMGCLCMLKVKDFYLQ